MVCEGSSPTPSSRTWGLALLVQPKHPGLCVLCPGGPVVVSCKLLLLLVPTGEGRAIPSPQRPGGSNAAPAPSGPSWRQPCSALLGEAPCSTCLPREGDCGDPLGWPCYSSYALLAGKKRTCAAEFLNELSVTVTGPAFKCPLCLLPDTRHCLCFRSGLGFGKHQEGERSC